MQFLSVSNPMRLSLLNIVNVVAPLRENLEEYLYGAGIVSNDEFADRISLGEAVDIVASSSNTLLRCGAQLSAIRVSHAQNSRFEPRFLGLVLGVGVHGQIGEIVRGRRGRLGHALRWWFPWQTNIQYRLKAQAVTGKIQWSRGRRCGTRRLGSTCCYCCRFCTFS